jgi:hypothetical protein
MKIPAILKSPYFLLFIAIIVIVVLVGRRDGYTWKVGSSNNKPVPDAFWSDPTMIIVTDGKNTFMTNEKDRVKPRGSRVKKGYTHCYSNVATGINYCFKSKLT